MGRRPSPRAPAAAGVDVQERKIEVKEGDALRRARLLALLLRDGGRAPAVGAVGLLGELVRVRRVREAGDVGGGGGRAEELGDGGAVAVAGGLMLLARRGGLVEAGRGDLAGGLHEDRGLGLAPLLL